MTSRLIARICLVVGILLLVADVFLIGHGALRPVALILPGSAIVGACRYLRGQGH